jgi:hypothetical protein
MSLAINDKCTSQLGCQLVWVGMPGMRWENVVHLIHSLINYRGIPFVVIIHCGGNDIGLVPCGELLFHIKFTMAILSSMLPGTSHVWSTNWHPSYCKPKYVPVGPIFECSAAL